MMAKILEELSDSRNLFFPVNLRKGISIGVPSGVTWGIAVFPTAFSRKRFFIALSSLVFLFQGYTSSCSLADVFVDDVGRRIEIKEHPSRIISLAPHITEILFDLNLGARVVGVTEYSDYPEAARVKEKVGAYVKLNLEKIISLTPDLIIGTADGNPRETVERLAEIGFSVFVLYPKDIKDIYRNIHRIGTLTGKEERAEEVANSLKKRIDAIAEKVKGFTKPKVFFQLAADSLYTAGKNTFIDRFIALAGGINIASKEKQGHYIYSLEKVLQKEPDVIFCSLRHPDHGEAVSFWKKWKTIPAVKKGRVYIINPDLIDRPSPRIADGLEAMAKRLHPEAFKAEE